MPSLFSDPALRDHVIIYVDDSPETHAITTLDSKMREKVIIIPLVKEADDGYVIQGHLGFLE